MDNIPAGPLRARHVSAPERGLGRHPDILTKPPSLRVLSDRERLIPLPPRPSRVSSRRVPRPRPVPSRAVHRYLDEVARRLPVLPGRPERLGEHWGAAVAATLERGGAGTRKPRHGPAERGGWCHACLTPPGPRCPERLRATGHRSGSGGRWCARPGAWGSGGHGFGGGLGDGNGCQ